jgi:hypothetical protein
MATFTQLPGALDIIGTRGDSVTVDVVFSDRNLTGVTFAAAVYTNTEAGYVAQTPAATPTVTVVSAASGHIKVTLSKTQTAALTSTTPYRWFLRETYADTTARATLAGTVTISSP